MPLITQLRNMAGLRCLTAPLVPLLLIALIIVPVTALTISPGSSQSSTPAISQGDSVIIRGVATGHPQQGLQVWLIGTNFVRVTTIAVNSDNTYEYEIKKAETQTMAPGQYVVLIQHPMMNGQFDITYNPATGQVTNRILGGGTVIFQLTGAGSLQGPAAASALMSAIASQNIDDTFSQVSFLIEPPNAFIEPIPDKVIGTVFTITGTTNLAAGDDLMVEITSSSFMPTSKNQPGGFSGTGGMVKVQPGSGGLNRWSYNVDTSTFRPDEYIVIVSAVLQNVRASSTFNVIESTGFPPSVTTLSTTTPATPSITTATALPTLPATTATPPPTTTKAPVPLPLILAGPLLAIICRYCRDKL
jgi:hypothetical protein